MSEARIRLPYEWTPRQYQLPLWRSLQSGCKRAVAVWHRRSGKDAVALNWTAVASTQRVGTYWHMLPEKEQARKAVWNGLDKKGRRIIDYCFPEQIRKNTLNNEMLIELRSGSFWQLCGSDHYDSLVGSNPVGVVFSEYSVGNPAAWDYIRPILLENGGWAIFLYTPRGRNHGHKLFQMAKGNPDWFAEMLTVNETLCISPEEIESERNSGMDDDMVQQEYFCSWEGVRQGSIFGEQLSKARAEGRIGDIPYDRHLAVNTFWDLGHSDATSIIAHQGDGIRDRFLKSYENVGQDIPHYVGILKDWGYLYGNHYLPHDAKNVTVASKSNPLGKNVWEQLIGLGLRDLKLVPRTPDKWTAINATRMKFSTAYFDAKGCEGLIDALASYHKKWDEARQCFSNDPYHDWSSNYCDAFQGWAQGYQPAGQTMTFTRPTSLPSAGTNTGRNRGRYVQTVGNRKVGY